MIKAIADYQLIAELKRSRYVTVYRAYEEKRGRFVLLKVLQATESATRARFEKEAAYLAKLQHDNLVRVLHYGETQMPSGKSCPFLALEFIEGQTLAEVMRDRKLPPDIALYLTREILAALSAAHRHNLVHRDIKPQNILLDAEGRVKVTDFGLAAAIGSLDANGEIVGTPQYMSPEQARGEAVTPASDLFALGVVLYEMLAAISPFDGETMLERIYRVTHETPAPLQQVLAPQCVRLSALVQRLLDKNPRQRFASADLVLKELLVCEEELQQRADATDLCRFLNAPEHYQPRAWASTPTPRAHGTPRRWRYVALAVLLLITLAGAWQLSSRRAENATSGSKDKALLAESDLRAPVAQAQQDSNAVLKLRPLTPSQSYALSANGISAQAAPEAVTEVRKQFVEMEGIAEEKAALQPAVSYLRLACLPVAYAVLNGDTLGQIDIEPAVFAVPAGKNILTLRNSRFPAVQQTLQAVAGDTLDWKVSLWENVALLMLNVRPWAEVNIDGVSHGKTPLGEIMLAPGLHTLTFSHPEREAFVLKRAFAAGQRDTLNIELRPR